MGDINAPADPGTIQRAQPGEVLVDADGIQWIALGSSHAYMKRTLDDQWVGIVEGHFKPDGSWCEGWIQFGEPEGWKVELREPLTLSPSLLCTICNSHGYIRDGKWVEA